MKIYNVNMEIIDETLVRGAASGVGWAGQKYCGVWGGLYGSVGCGVGRMVDTPAGSQ